MWALRVADDRGQVLCPDPDRFPALMIVAPPVENQIAPREKDRWTDGEIGKERKKGSKKCMEKERAT